MAGKSLDDAQTRLKEAGLESRSVVYQEGAPITEQWPQAGSRVPNTLTVELWVGKPDVTPDVFGNTPPTEAPQLAANDADTSNADTDSSASDGNGRDNTEPGGSDSNPNTSQTPEPGPTVPPQRPVAQAAPSVGTRYVLPPPAEHGARVNPRYRPAVPVGTQLTGPASWYGPKFHGLGDACGTVFNQHAATIATRELRCGTVVRITGPNGTVDAVVTDWGPAEWTGRRFDLSKATFNAIAPLGAGVVNVSMVTLNEPS